MPTPPTPPGDTMWRMTTFVQPAGASRLRPAFGILLFLLIALGSSRAAAQATPSTPSDDAGPIQPSADVSRPHYIDNDAVIKMSKAGLDDTIIIQTIQTQPGRYDTSPDDLIALKNAGLSQQVIAAMQARSAGLVYHATNKVNPAPLAAGIDEIGAYYQDRKTGEWIPLKTERVEFKSSGWLKNAATDGLIKQDMNGHLDGQQSPLVLQTGVNILIYTPAGTQPEEYDFIRFEQHAHSRDFRVKTGGLFHSTTGSDRDEVEFTPHKVAAQMYVFTVPVDIIKGEYGILPPGSSNVPGLSDAGKIFTFSIRE